MNFKDELMEAQKFCSAMEEIIPSHAPYRVWDIHIFDLVQAMNRVLILAWKQKRLGKCQESTKVNSSLPYFNKLAKIRDHGSLISRQYLMNSTATQFAYDDSNKLVSVNQTSGESASYTWLAGTDLRVSSSSSNGPTSYFVYDGENEVEILAQDKSPLSTIISIPDSYDEKLYSLQNDGSNQKIQSYLLDHLNSVRALEIDTANTSPEQEFSYYAFGGLRQGDPLQNMDFSYTGRPLDTISDLHYYRGRFYDSCTGTFTQIDPLQDGPNWYAYVGGNPINLNDPSGYGAAGAIAGGFAGAAIGGAIAGPPGSIIGRVIGSRAGSFCEDKAFPAKKEKEEEEPSKCAPCVPPVGSMGYGPLDDGKEHFDSASKQYLKPHRHVCQMNQDPKSCLCFWNYQRKLAISDIKPEGWFFVPTCNSR